MACHWGARSEDMCRGLSPVQACSKNAACMPSYIELVWYGIRMIHTSSTTHMYVCVDIEGLDRPSDIKGWGRGNSRDTPLRRCCLVASFEQYSQSS